MTPNSSAGPLATLVSSSSQPSSSSDSTLGEGVPSSGDGFRTEDEKGKFNQILQSFTNITSSEIELTTANFPVDGQAPLLPGQAPDSASLTQLNIGFGQGDPLQTPVHAAGLTLPDGMAGQLLPGQAGVAQPGQAQATDMLDGFLWSPAAITGLNTPTDPAQLQQNAALSAPMNADPLSVAGLTGGVKSPLSGNPLPAGAVINQSTIPNTLTGQGALQGPLNLLEPADHTAALQQGAFKAAADPDVLTRPAVPEFVAPLAKMLKPAMNTTGSTAAPSALAAASELTATLSEGDRAQVDALRTHAVTSSVDRPPLVQTTTAPIPLARLAGTPGWDQGLGQRILWMVDNGLKQAELRLDPPQLGSVNVRISMVDDQAQLSFQAQHPGAREALESALPKLREMFNQQGLELGDADISDDGNPGETGREAHNNEQGSEWAGGNVADEAEQQIDGASAGSSVVQQASGSLLVDEFV